jgi:secreted PhoX family phosphatase
VDRRHFLLTGAGAAATAAAAGVRGTPAGAQAQEDGWSRFDITGRAPDANGLILPEGFTSRVVAVANQPVEGTELAWHIFPDGGATFETDDGGYVYVSNSELPVASGGVGAIRFDEDGTIVDAYSILEDSTSNCAGGATPWGTWLSCEEYEQGRVWECDPTKPGQGEVRPALGTFVHEAVAVDADGERLYLTEDRPDGRFYRFTPAAYPDLAEGTLEVAAVADGAVTWLPVPDPLAAEAATRTQVPESTAFDGGEGIVVHDGSVFFTAKGKDEVWRYDPAEETIELVYDGSSTLNGVDNITATPDGDLLVAEDGGDMELVLVDASGRVQALLQCTDTGSELTGPAFDPSGTRLYFSSQRGGPEGFGRTFEVTGPFRTAEPPKTDTGTTDADDNSGGDDGGTEWVLPAIGATAVLAGATAVWRLRTRRPTD